MASLCAVALIGAIRNAGAQPLELTAPGMSVDLAPYVRYFEDRDKELGPRDALRLDPLADYKSLPGDLVDFGFTRSRFWLRAPVRNAAGSANTWKLSLDVPNLEEIAVYVASREETGEPRLIFSITDRDPFSARGEPYRNFVTDVELGAYEEADILIAFSSTQATQLPLYIESAERFYARVHADDVHNWTMFALLVGMTLMSATYMAALGFNTAFHYGAYILLSSLYLFHTDGYAFQYLWPEWPEWNRVAVAPIGLLLVATGSLFARAFVDAPRHHAVLNQVLLAAACGSICLVTLSFWLLAYDWFKTAALVFVLVCAALQLLAGMLGIRRGQAGAWLFFTGVVVVISTVVFGLTGYLNPGSFNQDTAGHAARYALIFEGAAFALAVFLHTQNLRRDHDVALQREVAVSREKLELSEALRDAESGYRHALDLAERRHATLVGTAHDIKQPLASLRLALMRLNETDETAARQIAQSFDYLDDLVRLNLDRAAAERTSVAKAAASPVLTSGDHPASVDAKDAVEAFPVSAVLDNVVAMFADEADANDVVLKQVPTELAVRTAPVPLMRMVSNLVSNAVKSARGGSVLIGCRRSPGTIRIEIHDTGPGLSDAEVKRVMKPYERGAASTGTGLGLALVAELARDYGLSFSLSSRRHAGTVAAIAIPLNEETTAQRAG